MANPEHLSKLKEGVAAWNARQSNLPRATTDLSGADLSGADLNQIKLEGANLSNANLAGADLSGANLIGASLIGANLVGANLVAANFWGANLSRANLRKADLRGSWVSLLNLNLATNFGRVNFQNAILEEAILREGDFPWADFTVANLKSADLTEARLNSSTLSSADLEGADLSRAELIGASLTYTRLRNAKLNQANLQGVIFQSAYLDGSDLTEATAKHTVFADVDLSSVKGLESVSHQAPSTIGIDTIFRSKGNIPEAFLRGCGLPDPFIVYARSLSTSSIEFYSCFISYSTNDQEFADRLYGDLQNKGVRCWFAPHDIQGGKKIHEQIDEAIRLHDKLLLILSPNSMNSEWVKTEIAKARKRELRDNRRVLFPIRLTRFEALRDWECFDADAGKDSAREIREYFIPDFSNWKDHDSYQKAFSGLINDLQAPA
jgi:uncharacterized protein YjbI with pentapeptide repeats